MHYLYTEAEQIKQPRCIICGQFYKPNLRAGSRQKTCGKLSCQKKQKSKQEREWREKNPEYYRTFYLDYIVDWRKKHPDCQRVWRAKKRGEIKTEIKPSPPIKSMRLHIRLPLPDCEIKTEFFKVTQSGSSFWVDGISTQVLRDKNGDRQFQGVLLNNSP